MPAPINALKSALRAGQLQCGLWSNLGHPPAAELAATLGFDWILFDGEHAPYNPETLRNWVMAVEGRGAQAVARVPIGRDWILKQVLDLGVQSVLVPMVNTADEATAMVAATRYPPQGVRGMGVTSMRASFYGGFPDYPVTANDQICLMVQAESSIALANLPAICAVDGVDCVFIGPADLAADMGYAHDLSAPEVGRAIEGAIATIAASGKAAGIITSDPVLQARYVGMGVRFLGLGTETTAFQAGLRGLLTQAPRL